MPSSLIVPLVTAGVSAGAQSLFSKGQGSATSPLTNFSPPGVNAGGLTSNFSNGSIGLTASPERSAAVGNLASTFGNQADSIAALRGTVMPGFSNARTAALQEIENARQSSIGNLRENLQRRRVLGSSFAQDAASRAEAEFAQQKAQTEAQSYLAELEATDRLMQEEFAARRGVFTTQLDELNLEANLAAGLAGKATDVLGKNAQVEAMLNAQEQQGQGKFFGQLMQPVADAAGKGAGKLFSGSAGTSPFSNGAFMTGNAGSSYYAPLN